MDFYFDSPDDTGLIVLWKCCRLKEVAHFDLREALRLQASLADAIERARIMQADDDDC